MSLRASIIKFIKAKCKDLHLSWDKPKHGYSLGNEWIASSPGLGGIGG